MGVNDKKSLKNHPKIGPSWEGFAMEEVISSLNIRNEECFFWGTHNSAELDLLTFQKGKRIGYEFKYSDVPTVTASMKIAIHDLKLDFLYIITPKTKKMKLGDKIMALSIEDMTASTR